MGKITVTSDFSKTQPLTPDLVMEMDRLVQMKEEAEVGFALTMNKALGSNDPTTIIKAQKKLQEMEGQRDDSKRKSFVIDPFQFNNSFGFKDKPISLTYSLLRRMAKTPIPQMIIRTRINQVAAFCRPQRDRFSTGFKIVRKSYDGETKMNSSDHKEAQRITDFVLNCGEYKRWDTDNFNSFTRKVIRDSLMFDQMTWENMRNARGELKKILATDASTFRFSDSALEEEGDLEVQRNSPWWGTMNRLGTVQKEKEIMGYTPAYVQIYQNQVVNSFYPWEMCFAIRNPTTEVQASGYGECELEVLIQTITSLLYSDEYNRRFFSQGSAPKGIIRVKGNVSDDSLSAFKQEWVSMIAGVMNAWKTPVMRSDEMDWLDLQKTNRDMEYTKWQEYLIKIATGIYQIDPAEIGFPMNSSHGNHLIEASHQDKYENSKDKGLYPLVEFYEENYNRSVISQLNDEFELCFVGLNPLDIKEETDLIAKRVQYITTINEERAALGMKPYEGGDVILNPILQQEREMQMMQSMQPGPGETVMPSLPATKGAPTVRKAIKSSFPVNPLDGNSYNDELKKSHPLVTLFDEYFKKEDNHE